MVAVRLEPTGLAGKNGSRRIATPEPPVLAGQRPPFRRRYRDGPVIERLTGG